MKDELENRLKRRRRRIRNQAIAYAVTLVVMAIIIVGAYLGIRTAVRHFKNYNEKVSDAIEEAEANASAAAEQESATSSAGQTQESTEPQTESTETQDNADPIDELVEALINEMSMEQMVAGMFMVSPESLTGVGKVIQAGESTKNAISQNPVGGLIYSAASYQSDEQFSQMLANTMGFSEFPLFLAVSKECGAGDSYGVEATQPASEITDSDSAYEAYSAIAQKLSSYGVNMDFAPVAEVVSEDGDASLQGRTFGSDASAAAPLVNAAVQSMQENEVSAVLQKFPGISDKTGTKSLEELNNSEFIVYSMAIQNGVDCIMVSHVSASGATGEDKPSSLSQAMITDVLRGSLGFDGVVITDRLNDEKITSKYNSAEAAVQAIQAGADILLEPQDYAEAYEGVLQAVEDGTISAERIHESIYRIYRVKYKNVLEEG